MVSLCPPPNPDARWAYFIDLDGTLIELALRPDAVTVPPGLPVLLGRLRQATEGAVAIVTGRPISTVDTLLAPLHLPVAGLHGLERRRSDGSVLRAAAPETALRDVRDTLKRFAGTDERLLIEDKGLTVALHFRLAPERTDEIDHLIKDLAPRVAPALVPIAGKSVVEFKPPTTHKGLAIRAFLEEAPFCGRLPVFLGDDVTDEDGFTALGAMGGISIRIGTPQPTHARFGLPSVAAAHDWLAQLSG
ncbi:MAG TPA: trehalose-phosphatase [Stellaceae bacterium]|nr:trehalose-phosphatase [Stellaceae bacterium]